MLLGERIKEARLAKGLTQKQLAEMLNTTDATVNRYEKGVRSPDPETLKPIKIFLLFIICLYLFQKNAEISTFFRVISIVSYCVFVSFLVCYVSKMFASGDIKRAANRSGGPQKQKKSGYNRSYICRNTWRRAPHRCTASKKTKKRGITAP